MLHSNQTNIAGKDILIVDDTLENVRLLSAILIQEGYGVRKALNGQMALIAVQTVVPDLILLDIMMPEMDGYEVCQRLKADQATANVPIIFLSALSEAFDKVKAFTVGGADYITKPFQFEEVLIRVRNQLTLSAAHIKNQQFNALLEERVEERTHQLELVNQELKREIHERKLLQSQLLEMALHDALTGLPNRTLFMERLERALDCVKTDSTYSFAVLFLDCDRFKVINDSLGHLVGDKLLVAIAERLSISLSQDDTLARLGGDEFAILLTNVETIDRPVQIANQLLKAFVQPFQLERHNVFINASIGIALSNSSYNKPEHLLRDADTAMYRAKALGKAQYQIFDSTMHDAALQLLQLESDLRRAISQNEFIVYYQSIINLKTGKLVGFEALARWLHPERGLILPGTFIPVAEEMGLISQIDLMVLRQACRQLCIWQHENLVDTPLVMSINLSAKQFAQPNLVEQIDQILMETQISPQSLKLEITESAIMNNTQAAALILQQLRERQIQLSIDDFGTGYSSLSYLHSFPVDTLKIDRSFIQRMDSTSTGLGLTPLIINIAHSMGMTVIAEGIETTQQLVHLKKLNCDFGQGYLFSKPLEAEKAMILMASYSCR